jgi:5-oxoprolinase (ATP-hydrolysing) subunit A
MTGLIDLNVDCGESFGAWPMGNDEIVLPLVSSANIACGFHAGDPQVMARTCALAKRHGVSIGAHPGLPDLQGFGRRPMPMSETEIETLVAYQIGALQAIAARAGMAVAHVKAHGALYNMAERDAAVAGAIARAVKSVDPGLVLIAGTGSPLVAAAEAAGLDFAAEGFPDRAYTDDGLLMSRKLPGAVIHDPAAAAEQAVRMARSGEIRTVGGHILQRPVQTLCIHGDEPTAAAVAGAVRAALAAAGIRVAALREVLGSR